MGSNPHLQENEVYSKTFIHFHCTTGVFSDSVTVCNSDFYYMPLDLAQFSESDAS